MYLKLTWPTKRGEMIVLRAVADPSSGRDLGWFGT
jgi:hypothetical protein